MSARTRPHFAAGNDDVSGAKRAALHQHGRDRAAAAVEPRFDHGAFRRRFGFGFELEHFRLQRDHIEQLVEISLFFRRHVDFQHVAAQRLHLNFVLQQLRAHALGLGVRFVDLVHRHDDWHVRRLGMVDRLDGLRHDAVVGCHDENRHVGHLRTAGAHRRERLVTRRVEERDQRDH